MNKLNDRQFKYWLKRVEEMADEKHEEHKWQIEKAIRKHKDCCPDLFKNDKLEIKYSKEKLIKIAKKEIKQWQKFIKRLKQ
jgi:excinuclease UvrABC ATPase subunit|tara:strand:+ start:5315 stop:5557 length:243 start_codon:yes stop_codon:yes gene_type:complete